MPGLRRARPSFRDAVLSFQPTAYWPMDGTPLVDLIRGKTGVVTGAPTFGKEGPTGEQTSIGWSGTGQYALAPAIGTPVASVTVLTVMRTSDVAAAVRRILCKDGAGGSCFSLYLGPTHIITWQINQSSQAAHCTVGAGTYPVDTWMLAVGTFDSTTGFLYQQGRSRPFTSSTSAALTGTWNLTDVSVGIAAGTAAGATPFPGDLAHCAIWNDRVLTATDARYLGSVLFG